MFNDWFLLVAFNLAVLSYYLGVLIYALPIPWYGIKRWGPLLIIDGIFSAILIFSFNILIQAVNYIFSTLNLSWNDFIAWTNAVISSIFSLMFFIQLVGNMLTRLSLGFIPNFFRPLYSLLSYSLTSLLLIQLIAMIIRLHYTKLIALGIALFAVPFRIARTAGAILISFSIVFYLGLPLLPLFVQSFAQSQEVSTAAYIYGVSFPRYIIEGHNGSIVPQSILYLYSINGSLLAKYIANPNGTIYASFPYKGSPSNYYKMKVEYLGYLFDTIPHSFINNFTCNSMKSPTNNTSCTINIHVPGILYASPCLVLLNVWNASIKNFKVLKSNEILLLLNVSKKGVYEIMSWSGNSNIEILLNNSIISYDRVTIDSTEWYANELHYLKIKLDKGLWNISVLLNDSCRQVSLDKDVIEVYYIRDTMNTSNILELVEYSSSYYFFSSIILPSSYLVLLTVISYGVALLLGGRYPRIPLRMF